ncbi:hypothetical protein LSTR_LSTR010240 [Laodelphax striatellus]|uniref:Uncharacterized protein n=1 Tax=Laodelphax striatellus TaxID=195883 RepID=A0A482WM01_LAOST|nr:hypothetical protein LSTR_LSTR010240 [Laodelphax striatellus]
MDSSMSSNASIVSPKKARKRPRQEEKWKKNIAKRKRKALTMQRIRAEDGDSGMNEEQELLCEPMEESTELRMAIPVDSNEWQTILFDGDLSDNELLEGNSDDERIEELLQTERIEELLQAPDEQPPDELEGIVFENPNDSVEVLSTLNNPLLKAMMEFVDYALGEFNAFFQSNAPLFGELKPQSPRWSGC